MDDNSRFETRTKIVATLGPASWDEPVLSQLLEAGVDCFRINCSHADHQSIRKQVSRVRRAAARIDRPTAILLDLQGPKIRTGKVVTPIKLGRGDVLTVVMDASYVVEGLRVGTTYPEMAGDVSVGDRVLFADGALTGTVSGVRRDLTPAEVDITMDHGGELGSHKGINLPGVFMSVPSLTEKDLADLAVGVEVGVDYVALSFVQTAQDVVALREELARLGAPDTPIIAKIEKPNAVTNLDAILEVTNGVMVARGDLGVEVSIEKVPVYQKNIIEGARRKGKLCITATQMLDSMERNPRPTRAETTDVANAILDGTDAVMLSGETATGLYPLEAVRMMDSISREVEASRFFKPSPLDELPDIDGPLGVVIHSACFAVSTKRRPMIVFTESASTAILLSKARPHAPIFALTPNPRTADRLCLAWGVTPILMPRVNSTDELVATGEGLLLEKGLVRQGEEVVILTGRAGFGGATNLLKVHVAGEED